MVLMRFALMFLWLFTALTSVFWGKEEGYKILAAAGIDGAMADICLYAGAACDAVIALWMLTGKALGKCYLIQLILIIGYSLILSILLPDSWFHPLGPLTKNLPLLAMILFLYQHSTATKMVAKTVTKKVPIADISTAVTR